VEYEPSLFEHFLKVLSLYLEASIWIRIGIRIRVIIRIRIHIRIHIKVMRIHNSVWYGASLLLSGPGFVMLSIQAMRNRNIGCYTQGTGMPERLSARYRHLCGIRVNPVRRSQISPVLPNAQLCLFLVHLPLDPLLSRKRVELCQPSTRKLCTVYFLSLQIF
jgi:hypothetical protein